jgi:hypothetical protein
MSIPTTPTTTPWTWSPEVLAFAKEQNVAQYLEPLLEVTRQLFPTTQSLKVYVDQDPEIRDLRSIVFEPHVPDKDLPSFVEAVHSWHRGLRRFCPAPLACVFSLFLNVVE